MELLINDCYLPLMVDQNRYIALKGGAGSGKSVFVAQKWLFRMTIEPTHRILVLRKVKDTIKNSVFRLFKDLINQYELTPYFRINKTDKTFTFTHPNGEVSEIICLGLDDREKIKSIQGITGIWLEEATEFSEEDLDQLDLRLRGHSRWYKQITISFNPVDINHWLKRKFFDEPSPFVTTLTTTYKHNGFLDDEYKKLLSERVAHNENLYRVYVLGEWGLPNAGGEFYKGFRASKAVRALEYSPDLPLHITWDFNVLPSVTCNIWQVNGKIAYQIDEITLKHPKNRTQDVCREFVRRYPASQVNGLLIYGDPAGRAEDTRTEQGFNDYKIITQALAEYRPRMRVQPKAPPIATRGDFLNACFSTNYDEVEIYINEPCSTAIADYSYLKEAQDGTKLKQRVKDEGTGQSYEQYGHSSDANDYFLCTVFKPSYELYTKGSRSHSITIGTKLSRPTTRY